MLYVVLFRISSDFYAFKLHEDWLQKELGVTGVTYKYCKVYIGTYQPLIFILENVLRIKANLPDIVAGLKEMGYAVVVVETSPHERTIPQSRPRIYIVGVLEALMTQEDLDKVNIIFDASKSRDEEESGLPMSNFLLPQSHPSILKELALVERRGMDVSGKGKGKSNKGVYIFTDYVVCIYALPLVGCLFVLNAICTYDSYDAEYFALHASSWQEFYMLALSVCCTYCALPRVGCLFVLHAARVANTALCLFSDAC